MGIRWFKYVSPFGVYVASLYAFFTTGFAVFIPIIYAFVAIPVAELFLKPDPTNLSAAEEELIKNDTVYDVLLWLIVPLQYIALFFFLYQVAFVPQSTADLVGKTGVMALLCGTFGINVGHELGHRVNAFEQGLAKALLLTSLYMHFFVEHNKGHHKNVATPHDPSSARYGEALYSFFFRTITGSYASAWHIANTDLRKKGLSVFSWRNEMMRITVIQIVFTAAIFFVFGLKAGLLFLAAALGGILLLETVNYIEHYGLSRQQIAEGKYERAMPHHSWNSSHVIGRLMLFELSRHSDHHYLASRKYQVLRHYDTAPQMPTGYPGMMLLALVPPLWFWVMNRRIQQMQENSISKALVSASG